ncbi:MAG TPA: hypothetical protein DCR93_23965 [Cytophagales bacterium]|nr:hypothetical protein [Cytophagales bacterium]HAP62421.1 hypothetical protein [Cytophagales bacterium]
MSILLVAKAGAQGTPTERKVFPVSGSQQSLLLDLPFGEEIRVIGWDRQEVAFEAYYSINNGELNEVVSLDYDDDKDRIQIEMEWNEDAIKDYSGTVSQEACEMQGGQLLYWSYNSNSEDNISVCRKLKYTVYVPREMKLNVETINSVVELRGVSGDMKVNSINGPIDLDWAVNQPANFKFESIHGDLFSNLDLDVASMNDGVGFSYQTQWKNEGPSIKLETINSSIYLRKQ